MSRLLRNSNVTYSDIDFQSAISVSSTGNSRSFTELTDQLAFVNFSSPIRNHSDPHPFVVVVLLLFYVHSKHLRSCCDSQLT